MPAAPTPSATSSAQSESGRTLNYTHQDMFWVGEPGAAAALEETYETVASFPGRMPTTALKIVKAIPKAGGEPQQVAQDQLYKLFIAPGLILCTLGLFPKSQAPSLA